MTSFDKNKAGLFGLKVFVVEDELLLVVELVDELEALGAILVGPIQSLEEALAAVEQSEIDVAILNVQLRGQLSFPLATLLVERQIFFCS